MIESQFNPCDEVTRFGFTAHGLATTGFDQTLRAHGAVFPLPFEWPYTTGATERYDTHLLKVPGIEPVELPEDEAIIEAAAGRTWQHYAILAEDRLVLFGDALKGWVCIDASGGRWLVRGAASDINMMVVDVEKPISLDLSVTPFGYLDEPEADPVVQAVTLSDAGQDPGLQGPPSASRITSERQIRIGSISSDGRRAVLELHGVQSPALAGTMRRNTAPAGFLMLELSGEGPAFTATLTVLRSQAQVLGQVEQSQAYPPRLHIDVHWSTDSTPRDGGADVITRPTGADMRAGSNPTSPWFGAGFVGVSRTGRVAALVFDDADQLVEFSYDASLRVDYNYPAPQFSSSGALAGWILDGNSSTSSNIANTAAAEMQRTSTEELTGRVVVRRNGAPVADGEFGATRTINERRSVTWPPQLIRVDGGVEGPQISPSWSGPYDYVTQFWVDQGAARTAWSSPHLRFDFGSYAPLGLWSSLINQQAGTLYAYGVNASYGVNATEEYGGGAVQLQRFSNNIFGVLVIALRGQQPQRQRVPSLAAPQAVWQNPAAQEASLLRQATYHPFTHEIFTDDSDGEAISQPFVWI
jgi:hypothetical protein